MLKVRFLAASAQGKKSVVVYPKDIYLSLQCDGWQWFFFLVNHYKTMRSTVPYNQSKPKWSSRWTKCIFGDNQASKSRRTGHPKSLFLSSIHRREKDFKSLKMPNKFSEGSYLQKSSKSLFVGLHKRIKGSKRCENFELVVFKGQNWRVMATEVCIRCRQRLKMEKKCYLLIGSSGAVKNTIFAAVHIIAAICDQSLCICDKLT